MRNMIKNIIKSIIAIGVLGISLYFLKITADLNILPNKYYYLLGSLILIFNIVGITCLFVKKIWTKVISVFVYAIILGVSLVGIKYGKDTLNFFNNAFNNNSKEVTTYNVYVLSNSDYNKINDLENKTLAYLVTEDYEEVLTKIDEKVQTENVGNEDIYDMYDKLVDMTYDAIVMDTAYIDVLEDDYEDISSTIKSIYSIDIEKEIDNETEKIEKLTPFNIYISGSDSRSSQIYNKTRSDVNMILTINPDTKTILMTSIPRDYYVQVHGQTGLKDKLTHAGIYGIDVSVKTVEDLFDIEIAYSIKIGMNAVVELVDLVGGIDVESDIAFNSYHMKGWRVQKGINHMDGAKALAYARERYAYRSGDRHRILNQQQVLEATLKKAMTSETILLKYNELLESLSNLYRTDIPKEVVSLLVKEQLNSMSSWTFLSQSVSGSDASLATHTAPNSKRYVMIPYEKDVQNAHDKILEILNY